MTSFAPHFPVSEFQAKSDRALTVTEQGYAAQLSQRLEIVRHAWGDGPVVITSYLRTDSTTQHGEGTAVDARRPRWVSWQRLVETFQALQPHGLTWGQLIIYPRTGHFHVSLPTGLARSAVLVEQPDGSIVSLTPAMLAALDDGVSAPAPAVGVALAVAGLVAAAAAIHTLGARRVTA